jgi:molecular chaperone DnaK
MLRDAEQHAAEDKQRRELVEARNTADSLAYSVERAINELADRVPAHERARAESLIGEIRGAIKDESTPVDRLRQLTSDLQQVSHSLASAAYSEQASAAGAGAGGSGGSGGTSAGGDRGADDDVIEAEYTPK